jgi:predicted HTH transcriptional regulator
VHFTETPHWVCNALDVSMILFYDIIEILDYTREHGRVTMNDMIVLTGVSRNTLKEHFKSLLSKGHLAIHGKGRGSWYSLP